MKYKQLIAELTALGCYVVRHGANHDIWFSPKTGCRCAVPKTRLEGSAERDGTQHQKGFNGGVIPQPFCIL